MGSHECHGCHILSPTIYALTVALGIGNGVIENSNSLREKYQFFRRCKVSPTINRKFSYKHSGEMSDGKSEHWDLQYLQTAFL
jgi:hypothetical protein